MFLSYDRYEEIKRAVVDLFETTGIASVPVNPWLMAAKSGIRLIRYSELPEKEASKLRSLCDGGVFFKNQELRPTIVYDDSVGVGRQRFTILHEMGHYILGHHQDSDLAEAEANFFAKYAIAPPMLVSLISPNDYIDIALAFGLSDDCAYYSMLYYQKWLKVPNLTDYELLLVTRFAFTGPSGEWVLSKGHTA